MKKTISLIFVLYTFININFAQCTTLSPITLPFEENFEDYSDTLSNNDTLFCNENFMWTFKASTPNGRAMCGNGSPVNNGGNGGVTFDVNAFSSFNHNELILTIDMSNYSLSNPIYLSFDCNNLADEPNIEDRIYIRGNKNEVWLEVYDWSTLPSNTWISENENIQIANILNSNGQSFSPSFQVKFSQYDNYGYSSDGFAIDNISIEEITCAKPQNLTLNHQNEDSMILSWDTGGYSSWTIEYGKKGFNFGDGTSKQTINSTDTITLLEANSIYEIYVQSNCGNGDFSNWKGPLTIYTKLTNDSSCNPIEVLANGVKHQTHNINATTQFSESFVLNNSPNNTIWFQTIVPASGHLAIETCNSSLNTELGAYQLSAQCSDLTTYNEIAIASFSSPSTQNICGSPGKSALEICNQTPGDTIIFWIGSYSPAIEGELIFSVQDYSVNGHAGETINPNLELCGGDSINLFNNITGYSQINNWKWYYNSNPNAIYQDSLLLTDLTTISSSPLLYIVNNTCNADTTSFEITVNEANYAGEPITGLDYCNTADIYLFSGLTGLIETNGSWYDQSGELLNDAIYNPEENEVGNLIFSYIADNNSCSSDTSLLIIELLNCSSIETNTLNQTLIYPNPNNGKFFFFTNNETKIKISDLSGRIIQVINYSTPNKEITIDLGNISTGIYLIETNNLEITKFIVK